MKHRTQFTIRNLLGFAAALLFVAMAAGYVGYASSDQPAETALDAAVEMAAKAGPEIECAACKIIINSQTEGLLDTYHALKREREYLALPQSMRAAFDRRAVEGDLALQKVYEPLLVDIAKAMEGR